MRLNVRQYDTRLHITSGVPLLNSLRKLVISRFLTPVVRLFGVLHGYRYVRLEKCQLRTNVETLSGISSPVNIEYRVKDWVSFVIYYLDTTKSGVSKPCYVILCYLLESRIRNIISPSRYRGIVLT